MKEIKNTQFHASFKISQWHRRVLPGNFSAEDLDCIIGTNGSNVDSTIYIEGFKGTSKALIDYKHFNERFIKERTLLADLANRANIPAYLVFYYLGTPEEDQLWNLQVDSIQEQQAGHSQFRVLAINNIGRQELEDFGDLYSSYVKFEKKFVWMSESGFYQFHHYMRGEVNLNPPSTLTNEILQNAFLSSVVKY